MPTAVVTGAGSGLGRAIAHDLAQRGYTVLATDVDADAAGHTAREIGAAAFSAVLDVCDPEACERAVSAAMTRTGSLDLWVNNAGVFYPGPVREVGAEARRAMIEVNSIGTMNGTLAALEAMIPAGSGHVVNIVSLAGLVAAPGEVAYSASKHAALAFTVGTAFDLRREGIHGIEVSAVCPDGIWTPMIEDALYDPEAAASFSGELLTPERVATAVGRLTEKPRPLLIVPRWRGPLLRVFALFPRLSLRLLPLVIADARRRQRRYARKISAGNWP